MDALIRAVIALTQAQIKLGVSLTEALLGTDNHAASSQGALSAAYDDQAIEKAAEAIRREMLRHKDVGFTSLLQTNFPPDEIRRMAQAALQAVSVIDRRSEEERQREKVGPREIPGKPDEAEMTPHQEKNMPKHVDPATPRN